MKKPKRCQWIEGFSSKGISGLHTCQFKPAFEVQYKGITLAHVCGQHSITAVQKGWQIR